MNQNYQRLAIWAAMLVLVLALWNLVSSTTQTRRPNDIVYSEFLDAVDKGLVADVTLQGNRISGKYKDAAGPNGTTFSTYAPEDATLVSRLRDKGVKLSARPAED
ncbi:MAG: ATP-dependent metallopeptidase FtsH/Yme1/Tma family protein, partial [Hyphomicrobium sp.]